MFPGIAVRAAKLAFICNVVINAKHQVVGAFASDSFMKTITKNLSAAQILAQIQAVPRQDTVPDQGGSQILAWILSRFHVVLISQADPALVRGMKMYPAKDPQEALTIADSLLGRNGTITVIPEGISAIIV